MASGAINQKDFTEFQAGHCQADHLSEVLYALKYAELPSSEGLMSIKGVLVGLHVEKMGRWSNRQLQ